MIRVTHRVSGELGGVWTKEAIEPGTVVWELTPHLDEVVTLEQLKRGDNLLYNYIQMYGWRSAYTGDWIIPVDAAKYLNWHEKANLQGEGDKLVAAKYIPKDRQLLVPFGFDRDSSYKLFHRNNPRFKERDLKSYLKYISSKG